MKLVETPSEYSRVGMGENSNWKWWGDGNPGPYKSLTLVPKDYYPTRNIMMAACCKPVDSGGGWENPAWFLARTDINWLKQRIPSSGEE